MRTPKTPFEQREFDRLVASVKTEATVTDGVIRWNSNNRVPPADIVAIAVAVGLPVDLAKSTAAREADLDAFVAEYRRNYKGPTDEERFEARAAFGPGVELVNVVTGKRWRT